MIRVHDRSNVSNISSLNTSTQQASQLPPQRDTVELRESSFVENCVFFLLDLFLKLLQCCSPDDVVDDGPIRMDRNGLEFSPSQRSLIESEIALNLEIGKDWFTDTLEKLQPAINQLFQGASVDSKIYVGHVAGWRNSGLVSFTLVFKNRGEEKNIFSALSSEDKSLLELGWDLEYSREGNENVYKLIKKDSIL